MAGNSRVRGVLRHKQMDSEPKDKFEDLLVFGYACKLFRDDEKASSIDQGAHLIPLMGDDSIKIDRYDARGTLIDLKPLDVPQGGYDRTDGLTAEERRVEALCDEERYFALYKDEAEEAVIKEEEIKRLNQDLDEVTSDEKSYHQVPFSYSNDQQVTKSSTPEAPVKSIVGELGDAIYMPPPALDVPPDMVVPPTLKLAKIIEKTASFISSQGTQMEIIVKAKQANNPMFQFLHFDSALHPFYRHVQAAIRNGIYVIPDEDDVAENAEKAPENVDEPTNGQSNESDSESDTYLHPSLQPKVPDEPAPSAAKTEETSSMFPPTDLRPLLDKTASYMAKKGRHLEAVVLSKGDTRFAFLKEDHNFHPYYIHKFTIYSEMHRNQQSAIIPAALQVPINTIKSSTTTTKNNGDPDVVRSDRRKRAALFLDNIRRQKIPAGGNGGVEDDIDAKSESTSSSSVKKSKSRSPADIEIIDARGPRERSLSRSPSSSSRKLRRSRSRQRSRSLSSVRSPGRIRGRTRSRSRSVHRRRSPSPERKRRHRKKHRSRDRHRKEKKKRRSRSRERSSRNKRSRRHRSRSGSRSSSGSRSPILSRGTSRSPLLKSRSPSEPRRSPISTAVRKLATEASKSSSETSSPLPAQLLTVQPTFSKIAEGIRAKVIAMIENDTKK